MARRVVFPIFMFALCGLASAADKINDLQVKFDSETNGVHKAKMIQKLGDAEFELAAQAQKSGDYATVGITLEKYRDNVRAAAAALTKDNPDGDRHPNGYKQLEMHVQKGLREIEELLLIVPDEFKPPLQLVRQDLLNIDNQLLRSLFPTRHEKKPPASTPPVNPLDQQVHFQRGG